MTLPRRARIIELVMIAIGLSLCVCGCAPSLNSEYAVPRSVSINGVTGFVNLLRLSGRKVDVVPGLFPQMKQRYQTVIVFDSTFDRPSQKLIRNIDDLLRNGNVETLIIVVRDSDASIDYWRQIRDRQGQSPDDIAGADRSYNLCLSLLSNETRSEFDAKTGNWYGLKRVDRSADELTKSVTYTSENGSFSVAARWPLNRRLEPPESAEVLWKTGDEPLLTLQETGSGEVMVLGSATPLLNGGLVDQGNRVLASQFVRRIPESDRIAVAVSSLWIDDSNLASPSLLQFMKVHPNGWVFGQAILAMLLFCWWKFPILGRPRQTISTETARFGRHIEALGNLLRRTRDLDFAKRRIRDWNGDQKPQSNSKNDPRTIVPP